MLVSVEGVYQDGQIHLNDDVSVQNDTKVIVTFLEEKRVESPAPKRLTLDDFSFRKSQEALKDYKGSFSDAVIEERREALLPYFWTRLYSSNYITEKVVPTKWNGYLLRIELTQSLSRLFPELSSARLCGAEYA